MNKSELKAKYKELMRLGKKDEALALIRGLDKPQKEVHEQPERKIRGRRVSKK